MNAQTQQRIAEINAMPELSIAQKLELEWQAMDKELNEKIAVHRRGEVLPMDLPERIDPEHKAIVEEQAASRLGAVGPCLLRWSLASKLRFMGEDASLWALPIGDERGTVRIPINAAGEL